MKILIVEDSKSARFAMQDMLSQYGECEGAENGKEGVEAFESAIESGQPYDLVCLDIMMPVMDGQEALLKIREIEEDHGIMELDEAKIIMTSGLSDSKSITDAFYKGEATSYIVKPVTEEKLVEKLRSLDLIST
jgi:two-component system chemotaxis response regulator CheY